MGEPSTNFSSCSAPFFREKFASLAGDRTQIDEEDWKLIQEAFDLNLYEQSSLRAFRKKLEGTPVVNSREIQEGFTQLLERASKRQNRKSAFGRFVLLFGEGSWEKCFPELSKERQEVEEEVLRDLSNPLKRLSFSWNDVNLHINIPLFDVGSNLRCFSWEEGDQNYICGIAKQEVDGDYLVFHFEVLKQGNYPKDASGNTSFGIYDGRRTIAVFDQSIDEVLARKEKKRLREKGGSFVQLHEKAHTAESYDVKRLIRVGEKERGWKEEAIFDCAAHEILADIEAFQNFKGEPGQAALIFEALHTKLNGEARTCAEYVDRLTTRFLQGAGGVETTLKEAHSFFKAYRVALTQAVTQQLKPYEQEALANLKREGKWEPLEEVIQKEKWANEQVRLFFEKDPKKGEEIRLLIQKWRRDAKDKKWI